MNTKFMIRKPACSIALYFMMSLPLAGWAQISGDTFSKAKQSKKARISMAYVETPGFSERKGDDIVGVCPDIMEAFFSYLENTYGIAVEKNIVHRDRDYPFGNFLLDVSKGNGGVFGLGNITITEERKNFLDFSDPFIDNVTIIMSNSSVETLDDIKNISTTFSGMYAVTIKNTTNEKQVEALKARYWPDMKIEFVSNQNEALAKCANDPKAFTNLDFTYYLAALKHRSPIKRHPAGDQSTEQFGFMMPKGSDWGPVFNAFLNDYVGGPEYRKVISAHLGSSALKLLDSVSGK